MLSKYLANPLAVVALPLGPASSSPTNKEHHSAVHCTSVWGWGLHSSVRKTVCSPFLPLALLPCIDAALLCANSALTVAASAHEPHQPPDVSHIAHLYIYPVSVPALPFCLSVTCVRFYFCSANGVFVGPQNYVHIATYMCLFAMATATAKIEIYVAVAAPRALLVPHNKKKL